MSPAPMPAGPAAPAPQRRRTSPIVWILIVILGFFALCVVALIGTGIFFAHRPGYAIAKLITAANPDAEVVSTDDGSQTVTIRNRRTGHKVTMSFSDVQRGRFRLEADDDNGKHAAVEFGGTVHAPSWVPVYPGSETHALVSAQGESDEGMGEGGAFTFTTPDPPSRVRSFYEDEGRRAGLEFSFNGGESGVIVLKDPGEERKVKVTIAPRGSDTFVSVAYGRKR